MEPILQTKAEDNVKINGYQIYRNEVTGQMVAADSYELLVFLKDERFLSWYEDEKKI